MDQKHNMEQGQSTERIELRSNEVQEILSRPPKWIVRWGISVIFFVIGLLLVGSWFFKYPDIISSTIVVTTENPPAPIVAKTSGKIQKLLVLDNDLVVKNQFIAIIENPADYQSILKLNKQLDHFKSDFESGKAFNVEKASYELGIVQSGYSSFNKAVESFNQMIRLNYHDQKIALYYREIAKYNLYLNNLKTQSNLLNDDFKLTGNQFQRDSLLYIQSLISNSEYERSKSQLIAKQYNLEQNNTSIANINLQVESLKQNILELELQKQKQFTDQKALILETYENLKASIEAWKYQYVLVAPTNGKVTFNQFWNENQTVKVGDEVMTVIPDKEGEIIGKVKLNFQGAGKVKVGQKANIQFSNYPFMEFGMVQGIVKSISLAPNNDFYTVEIHLPNGLQTFYGTTLEFKQQMQGTAEIVTEDFRLLERIVRPLRMILKKNTNLID